MSDLATTPRIRSEGLEESVRTVLRAWSEWVERPPRDDAEQWEALQEAMFSLAQHAFVPRSPEYEAWLSEYVPAEEQQRMAL